MNLVGKIFTVLIFVMALVFGTCAVFVYATHKNWREIVMRPREEARGDQKAGLTYRLDDAREANRDLKDRRDAMEEVLEQERNTARASMSKLTAEYKKERAVNTDLLEDLKTARQEALTAIAALKTTQDLNNSVRKEVKDLREEIRDAQKTRDEKMSELILKTDQLLQAENELRRLKDQLTRTADDLAKARQVLDYFKLEDDPAAYVNAEVDGIVMAVRGTGMIEISIGSDDGLNKGAYLRIFRADGSMYLGRAQVLQTAPDKSVCKVIPEERKGVITKGDRVSSGINDK